MIKLGVLNPSSLQPEARNFDLDPDLFAYVIKAPIQGFVVGQGSLEIHVVHTAHPLNQELFRMMSMATPREVTKAIKNTSQTQYTTCSTTRPKLQTCKQAWFTPSVRQKGTRKLVETFVCNVTLITMLQVCAALDLNLVNDKTKEIGFKVPFMIRVDIAIGPSRPL
ncbi:hypothetical protein JVT61DRAFT_9083 [Boletus reticuloceps]|uniref:Uncharacterized protein n=1 Tax=Boletus reticuloceps TaxID=495285 RepID=A0A8I2YGQ6_9AGAM|nr:hypothetical protein JVT61DRAFT_9083 [Boletus reticuloceps]